MSLISARGIHKAFGPQVLLKSVSLTIEPGERIGLLGVNGAGKSTFLKILAGAEPIDDGVIDRGSGARILYLPQEPELDDTQTPRQIVQTGLGDWSKAKAGYDAATEKASAGDHDALMEQAKFGEEIERLGGWEREFLCEDMLQKLGVREIDRPVGGMSGGERRRVALARLLVAAPDLAILDEPTNHLDVETIEWLEGFLENEFEGSVMLVTHDRYVLDAIATKIVELEYGQLYEYIGAYSDYLDQKADRLAHEGRVEDNRQNFLRREKEWLSRGPKARSTKQKARIQRAHAAIAIEAPRQHGRVELAAASSRTGKTILELEKVGVRLDNGRQLFRDLDLSLVSGDRVGIVGPNGVGKTTLLRLVNGEVEASSGKAIVGKNTKIAYFDQARAGLEDDWSIYDNVAGRYGAEATGGGMVEIGELKLELRAYLERFLFEKSKQRQKVGALSGGERARVALAKLLRGGANLLLLDEPTNDLDVTTLGALEEMLGTWPGCALVVSHDRAFLDGVATAVLAFEESTTGAPPIRYAGGYTEWRERKAENEAAKKAAAAENAPASKRGGSPSSPPKAASTSPSKSPPPWKTKDASAKSGTAASGRSSGASAPPMPKFAVSDAPASTSKPAASAKPAGKPLSYTERIEFDGIMDKIAAAEETAAALEKQIADPSLWTSRAAEAPALQAKLDAAKALAAKLTTRWEELELRSAQKT